MHRAALVAGGAAAALLLTGCGGDDTGAKPDLPTTTPALWNPCDVLDAPLILKAFGSHTKEEHGTPTVPECRFKPDKSSGEAVVTSSYTLFQGTLAEAWQTMRPKKSADVRNPTIEGADDARVVVDVVKKQLYVTGFVENGDLIQNVNVVDPAPYDEARVVAGVSTVLTALSRHADAEGVNDGSSESE